MTVSFLRGLYPILDADVLSRGDFPPEDVARAFAEAGIAQAQLRCKADGGAQYAFLSRWIPPLRRFCPDTRLLINDRADLALLFDADGLHLGQDDLPASAGRSLLGAHRIVGLSTHSLEEMRAAPHTGADYIGFGPIFPTVTKQNPSPVQGLETLYQVCRESPLPVVAIGGISLETLPRVVATGVAAVAMIGGIFAGDWRERVGVAARECR